MAVTFKLRVKTIKGKMIIAVLTLSIMPLVLLGIFSYQVSRNAIFQQVEKIHDYNIHTYDKNITLIFENLRQSTNDFLYGKGELNTEKMISLLEKEPGYYEQLSVYRKASLIKMFKEQVYIMMPNNVQAKEIVLKSLNGVGFRGFYKDGLEQTEVLSGTDYVNYKDLFDEAVQKPNKEIFVNSGSGSFYYMKVIYGLKSFRPIGYLLLTLDSNILQTILPAGEELNNAAYVVVDTRKSDVPRIVFYAGQMDGLEEKVERYYAEDMKEYESLKIGRVTNMASGWDVLYLVNKNELSANVSAIRTITEGFVIAIAFIIVLLAIWISRLINRPLEQLVSAIRKVGEGKDYVIDEQFGDDEIGRIGNQFKNMVEQNLNLKDRLYRAEIKQKESELIALQAQINPHFLYNTLDSIYLMTQMGRAVEAGKMTLALSDMFKISLSKGREFIKVKDEVNHIKNYLYIQKMRYGNKIDYEIEVSDRIMEEQMLKLILQPIIENSIYHGLEPKGSGGMLVISGGRQRGDMVFSISDNGVGMENEEWKKGYGLMNVMQRIQLYYGDNYGIEIESKVGKGTRVTVCLPVYLEGWIG